MKLFKEYEVPTAEVLVLDIDDLLTLSAGFDGEEHEFLSPMNPS